MNSVMKIELDDLSETSMAIQLMYSSEIKICIYRKYTDRMLFTRTTLFWIMKHGERNEK